MSRFCIKCSVPISEEIMIFKSGIHFCPICGLQLLYRIDEK